MLERLHGSNEVLRGRKILVVDDDARNIFALTSLLENHDMEVISTTNGRDAIEIIERTPDLSIVLMDIMMPDMDGYETIGRIRENPAFSTPADPCAYRKSHEGRSREVPERRRQRLYRQAREHRPASVLDAGVAVPLKSPSQKANAMRRVASSNETVVNFPIPNPGQVQTGRVYRSAHATPWVG